MSDDGLSPRASGPGAEGGSPGAPEPLQIRVLRLRPPALETDEHDRFDVLKDLQAGGELGAHGIPLPGTAATPLAGEAVQPDMTGVALRLPIQFGEVYLGQAFDACIVLCNTSTTQRLINVRPTVRAWARWRGGGRPVPGPRLRMHAGGCGPLTSPSRACAGHVLSPCAAHEHRAKGSPLPATPPPSQVEIEVGGRRAPLSSPRAGLALDPGAHHTLMVNYTIKEPDTHVLAVHARYVLPTGVDGAARASFRFSAVNPLVVKTKVGR